MATKPDILTADDVLDLPVPDELIGYELVDGKAVPVTPASRIHGGLIVVVAHRLHEHVQKAGLPGKVLSDAGFVHGLPYDRERVRSPDVSYVGRVKLDANPDPMRLLRCAPDLAIEIDLTSGKKPGGKRRIMDYLEAGTPLVWVIDPESRSATAYHPDGSARLLRGGEALDGEDVVPGLRLELGELF